MEIITLSRMLDCEAKKHGYQYFPDDCLSIILDYKGGKSGQAKNIYQVYFDYRVFTNNQTKQSYISTSSFYYCDCCQKFFVHNPKNHDKGVRHKSKINNPDLSVKDIMIDGIKWKNRNRLYPIVNPHNFRFYDIGFYE